MGRSLDRIIEAARELFAEKGFDAASLREIAERAGVSKALIVWYFSSKEELVKRIALEALPTGIARDCIDRGLSGRRLVECIVNDFLEKYRDDRVRRLLVHAISLAIHTPSLGEELRRLCRTIVLEVAKRVYGSISPENVARARSLFGALLCHAINPVEEVSIEEFRDALINIFAPRTRGDAEIAER